MKIPERFNRISDGKPFRRVDVVLPDQKIRIRSHDESDDVTWVSDNFFVSGSTGHTFKPYVHTGSIISEDAEIKVLSWPSL